MKIQQTLNQSWQTANVSPSSFVVRASRFAGATTTHHAAAMKAVKAMVKGPQPWSPPVT
ncbi:MAG: hypothetical protein NTV23_08350 [Propionibacteriales bacterium]|nr:hypothetical protein [Propionibacteriales bacterium]